MATKKRFNIKDHKIVEVYSEDKQEARERMEEGLEILASCEQKHTWKNR